MQISLKGSQRTVRLLLTVLAMFALTGAADSDTTINKLLEDLAQTPDDGALHYQLGSLLMDSNGDLETAAEHFESAIQLQFQPLGGAYRLSRIYAQQGERAKALEQLEVLAAGGFGQIDLIDGQADYDSLRDDARFLAATETIRATRFPCNNDERHHAFDFWIGEWTVTQNGQFAGDSSVQPMLGHCTLFEQWRGASGTEGKSFNYYDPGHDHWRQIWISDSGSFIEFTGAARDGGIYFTAQTIDPANGSITDHKFEFTQLDGGIVRQSWETSTDGGITWTSIWDGRYERKTE
jgi:hypothetical protein